MDRPRIVQLLRIAFSAVGGIVCLMLVALWARSANTIDCFYCVSDTGHIVVWSSAGKAFVNLRAVSSQFPPRDILRRANLRSAIKVALKAELAARRSVGRAAIPESNSLGFMWRSWQSFVIPYWFPVAIAGTLATTPWIKWRFSLRALLITITFVAVLLGAVVYAVR